MALHVVKTAFGFIQSISDSSCSLAHFLFYIVDCIIHRLNLPYLCLSHAVSLPLCVTLSRSFSLPLALFLSLLSLPFLRLLLLFLTSIRSNSTYYFLFRQI